MVNCLVLLQEYFPKDVRVVKELKALEVFDMRVCLICLQGPNEELFETIDNIDVYRVPVSKKRGSRLNYILEYFGFYWKAKKIVKELCEQIQFDVVHVHNLPDFLVFAAKPAKKQGAKIILDMHEITPEFYASKYKISMGHPIIKLLEYIEKKSFSFSDVVITVNEPLKETFEQRSKAKRPIEIVMNTVNGRSKNYSFPTVKDEFTAIYHGTLSPLYNLDFAINALALDPEPFRKRNFIFKVYGSGSVKEHWERLAKRREVDDLVQFMGVVPHVEMLSILKKANLGLLTLKKDVMTNLSFSNKLAEYIFFSIPVLSSDLDSYKAYFPDSCINYFEADNYIDFREKLLYCIDNHHKLEKKVVKARQEYSKYDWTYSAEKLVEIYSSLLDGNVLAYQEK